MADKLCLLVCENLEREVSRIVESERFDDVAVRTFEAHCDRPLAVWDALRRAIRACEQDGGQIHVLGGACLAGLKIWPAEMERCRLHKLEGCYSLFVGNDFVAGYLQSGAYLLTPGWLARWRGCVSEWGFDQDTARKFFAESATRLTLLDTGVDATSAEHLAEFARFVDLPFESVPVGLDYARLFLTRIVLEWRAENARRQSAEALTSANRRLADHAMVLDLIGSLPKSTTETQAIDNILDLFAMLCAPISLIYIPVVNGQPGEARSRPDLTPITHTLARLAAFDRDYAWTDAGNGFLLRISHQDETLGILEIEGLAFPEYKQHYLNLALTVVQVCSLAIANARAYQKQQSLIEELKDTLVQRQQAEEALRIKDQAIQSSINAIAIGDPDGHLTYTNAAFLKLWGYDDQDEVLGRSARDFWLVREQASAVMDALHEQGYWIGELVARRKDGSTFDAQLAASVVTDRARRPISLMASFVDVTERKQAEKEIGNLAKFLAENPNPILRLSSEGILLYANDASQTVLREWGCGIGEPAPEFWRKQVAQVLASELSQIVDVSCEEQVFSFVVVPVMAAGYVNLYGQDITERKKTEQALRESESIFASFMEYSPVYVFFKDKDTRALRLSENYEQMLGIPANQALGKTMDELFPSDLAKSMVADDLRILSEGQVVHVVEEFNGRVYETTKFPILQAGVPNMLAGFTLDITERKRAEDALRQVNLDLHARNQELDTFAHTAAHDLKTPLGLIVGYADLFADLPDASPDEMRHTLRAIVRHGRKLGNIIDELLLLSEVRSAQVPLTPIQMASVLAEVQERFAFDIQERQVEIVLPAPSAWPMVQGYAPWLEEVWANYISNAIKYGGTPPRIEIGATRLDDGWVRFWVRDNGRGLSLEDQARLFQPFARLDQARAKGHGLGLSIVRRIVEKLGGQVGVESQLGQGSVFSFTLPAAPLTRSSLD